MRLALISQDFPPEVGGIETYSMELAARFSQKASAFWAIAPDKETAAQFDQKSAYPICRISCSNTMLGTAGIPKALPLLQKHQLSTSFHTQWQTLPISILARRHGITNTIFNAAHARELLFNPFNNLGPLASWYDQYRRWSLKQADFHFPVSDYTADLLVEEGISRDKMEVVGNGTDPEQFYPVDATGLKNEIGLNGKQVLLTITRLVERKGVDTVLRALRQLKDRYTDLHYVVVGDGPHANSLKESARQMEVADRVHFTGRVPYDMLNDYYNLADIFVMPSKTITPDIEGFGIVFLEANACAKPVIGSTSGGIPSAINDGETGLLVEEERPSELADAIESLLEDPDRAHKMGEQGRERILREANWDSVTDQLFQLMQTHQN